MPCYNCNKSLSTEVKALMTTGILVVFLAYSAGYRLKDLGL